MITTETLQKIADLINRQDDPVAVEIAQRYLDSLHRTDPLQLRQAQIRRLFEQKTRPVPNKKPRPLTVIREEIAHEVGVDPRTVARAVSK